MATLTRRPNLYVVAFFLKRERARSAARHVPQSDADLAVARGVLLADADIGSDNVQTQRWAEHIFGESPCAPPTNSQVRMHLTAIVWPDDHSMLITYYLGRAFSEKSDAKITDTRTSLAWPRVIDRRAKRASARMPGSYAAEAFIEELKLPVRDDGCMGGGEGRGGSAAGHRLRALSPPPGSIMEPIMRPSSSRFPYLSPIAVQIIYFLNVGLFGACRQARGGHTHRTE